MRRDTGAGPMGGADGRRAVVTGAARGIGQATARRLLREGASVLAVDLDAEGLREIAAEGAETLVASVADADGRAAIAAAAGRDRLPRQRRGHPVRALHLGRGPRGVAPAVRRQRGGHLLPDPGAGQGHPRRGRHRQSRLQFRQAVHDRGRDAVLVQQGGRGGHHPVLGVRPGAPQHPRERHPAGHHRHPDAGSGAGAGRAASGHDGRGAERRTAQDRAPGPVRVRR